jgi:hypothetical protein
MKLDLIKVTQEIDGKYESIENEFIQRGFVINKKEKTNDSYNIHHYYPLVFFDDFSNTNECNDFINLSILGRLLFNFCLLQDKILDMYSKDYTLILRQNAYFNEALNLMFKEFSKNTQLWKYFKLFYDEYISASLLEKKMHQGKITSYSLKDMEIIGAGKSALTKIIIAALTKDPAKLNRICKSNDFFI